MNSRQFFLIALPTVASIIFVGLLLYSLTILLQINQAMRMEAPNNMLWVVSRAETSSFKLELAVEDYMSGQIDKNMLVTRYQIFLSRVNLLKQGPQYKAMVKMGFESRLNALNEALPSLQANLLQLHPNKPEKLRWLQKALADNSQFFGLVANKAMVTSWDSLGNKLDQVKQQLWRILAAMLGLLVAGWVIITHLWLAMREAKKNALAFLREHKSAETYRNFGAMISHQFRTPLAIIDSSMQRLIRKSEQLTPEEIRQRGKTARGAVERLIQLIDSVLEAARMEAGQLSCNSRSLDFASVLKLCCKRAQESEPQRHIVIQKVRNNLPNVFCDPVHTEQIIDILLTNALKYSPKESDIIVKLEENNEVLECHITNQGSLAGLNIKDDIFKRYFRGDNAEGTKGLGIGLYMAKNLALQQQGNLSFVEQQNKVTFILSLPKS